MRTRTTTRLPCGSPGRIRFKTWRTRRFALLRSVASFICFFATETPACAGVSLASAEAPARLTETTKARFPAREPDLSVRPNPSWREIRLCEANKAGLQIRPRALRGPCGGVHSEWTAQHAFASVAESRGSYAYGDCLAGKYASSLLLLGSAGMFCPAAPSRHSS